MRRGAAAGAAIVAALGLLALSTVPAPAGTPPSTTAPTAGVSVLQRGRGVVHPALANSVPKVGAPLLWPDADRGSGKVIAVIDTGVSPSFGGTLVGGACFAATTLPGGAVDGHCGPSDNDNQSFSSLCFSVGVCDAGDSYYVPEAGAGDPCSAGQACSHGSAVAAVAARHEPTPGVAPDAGVYSIRVFNPGGTSADLFDVALALDHVRQLKAAGVPIVAVNLSVATTQLYAGHCDGSSVQGGAGPAFAQLFAQLMAIGVPSAVASGNAGDSTRLSFPACTSTAVAVGATDLDDDVASFSNRGSDLDLYAPGATEASPGSAVYGLTIPSGTGYETWAGTSFAAPHVAGALVLLAAAYPEATGQGRVDLLIADGVPVAGHPRLQLGTAADLLLAGSMFPARASLTGPTQGVAGDFDADGATDVFGFGPGSAHDGVLYGVAGHWRTTTKTFAQSATGVVRAGNFRGAASSADDLLFFTPGTGADSLWVGSPARTFATSGLTVNGTQQPVVGDVNGDGWDDVLWYGPGSQADSIWLGGATSFTVVVLTVNGTYVPSMADLDGNGTDEIVWYGPGTTPDYVSAWTGSGFSATPFSITGSYQPLPGDLDGDGTEEITWYGPGTLPDYVSDWTGTTFTSVQFTINGSYVPRLGDFDGDGKDEVLWYGVGGGADYVGDWTGTTFTAKPVAMGGGDVPVVAPLDAGEADSVVFLAPSGGTSPVWFAALAYVTP